MAVSTASLSVLPRAQLNSQRRVEAVARAGDIHGLYRQRRYMLTVSSAVAIKAPSPPSVTMTAPAPSASNARASSAIGLGSCGAKPNRMRASLAFGVKISTSAKRRASVVRAGAGFKQRERAARLGKRQTRRDGRGRRLKLRHQDIACADLPGACFHMLRDSSACWRPYRPRSSFPRSAGH